ncbi:MAG: hypothetical protein RIT33_597 [Pseudomonadota bacterium]|jgi:uncharacterized membrane-anchored protein
MRSYDHPLRTLLHEEVHARPPVALWPRDRILNQAFLLKGDDRQQQLDWINAINEQTKQTIDPNHGQTFRIIELRPAPQRIIIKWELHGEFSSISAMIQQDQLITEAPIKSRVVLENEVNQLLAKLNIKPMHEAGGLRISAIDVTFEDRELFKGADEVSHLFSGNTLIGSTILTNQKAQLWTDLQVNEDGYISFLVPHAGMGSRQAGRVARRITEVEIYRMASMLAFPVAKSLSGPLRNAEAELSELSKEISMAQNQESMATHQDGEFLERISTLASKIEEWISEHGLRFTAAEAYSQLTAKNLEELSETSLPGVQTLSEFMERRFAPAMSTCSWTQRRLRELSDRISRTTQILRTRIEFVNERQTQELLASMDRRAKIQLRLQATVEGVSVLVLTYYAVSLIIYMAKGVKELGLMVPAELIGGASAPIIAYGIYALNKLRKKKFDPD